MLQDRLIVLFDCPACGLLKAKAPVRLRGMDEDVVVYVRDVIGRAMSEAHDILAPLCRPKSFSNVMIPMKPGSELGIGQELP